MKSHLFFSIFFFVTCGGCRADLEIGGRRAETTLIILNISTSNFVANNLPDFWGQAIYSQLESRQRVTSYKERDKKKLPLEFRNDEFCQQFDWEDCLYLLKFIYSEKATKILRNLPLTFDCSTYSQKLGVDFAKCCGLLRIYELYHYCSLSRSFWKRR